MENAILNTESIKVSTVPLSKINSNDKTFWLRIKKKKYFAFESFSSMAASLISSVWRVGKITYLLFKTEQNQQTNEEVELRDVLDSFVKNC